MLVSTPALICAPAHARKVTLSTSDLKYIFNNVDVYLAAPNDPLLIITSECPNPNFDAHIGPVSSKQATVAVFQAAKPRMHSTRVIMSGFCKPNLFNRYLIITADSPLPTFFVP